MTERDSTGPEVHRLPAPDPVYGTPTAPQLLAAVRDLLRDEILDSTSGHTRYLLRVAIHVVDVVRRQCEQGDGARRALAQALAELGVTDEAELANAIRAGAFDDRQAALRRYLTAAVATRLAVDNPRYGAGTGLTAADLRAGAGAPTAGALTGRTPADAAQPAAAEPPAGAEPEE